MGCLFYKVGTNQYVRVDAIKLNTNDAQSFAGDTSIRVKQVATINDGIGYGTQVWQDDFRTPTKQDNGSNKKLNTTAVGRFLQSRCTIDMSSTILVGMSTSMLRTRP